VGRRNEGPGGADVPGSISPRVPQFFSRIADFRRATNEGRGCRVLGRALRRLRWTPLKRGVGPCRGRPRALPSREIAQDATREASESTADSGSPALRGRGAGQGRRDNPHRRREPPSVDRAGDDRDSVRLPMAYSAAHATSGRGFDSDREGPAACLQSARHFSRTGFRRDRQRRNGERRLYEDDPLAERLREGSSGSCEAAHFRYQSGIACE
jgi:hypothetical protein